MNIKINPETVLVFYDVPQLFVGTDQIGTKYLCVCVNDDDGIVDYLVKPVSTNEISDLCHGRKDLRSLYSDSRMNRWFLLKAHDADEFAPLRELQREEIPQEYWPEPGFRLDLQWDDEVLAEKVIEIGRPVIALSINGNTGASHVSASVLGDILRHYQALVKYVFKKAVSKIKSEAKRQIQGNYTYQLDAFATGPGSFRIYLMATSSGDLFGDSDIAYALARIDDLITENDNVILDRLRDNKGHAVSSYEKLLQTIKTNEIVFSYAWIQPGKLGHSGRSVNHSYADRVLELIRKREDLGTETKTISGHFLAADVETGKWTLEDPAGERFHGTSSGEILKDRKLFTKMYKINCTEMVEEVVVSGQEKITLKIESIDEL